MMIRSIHSPSIHPTGTMGKKGPSSSSSSSSSNNTKGDKDAGAGAAGAKAGGGGGGEAEGGPKKRPPKGHRQRGAGAVMVDKGT